MVVVLCSERDDLAPGWHALLAWLLVGIAVIVTIWLAVLRARRPLTLLEPATVVVELAVGLALMVLDGVVFPHGHIGSSQSSLATAWPLAGVLSAGVAYGEWPGLLAGFSMGLARFASVPLNSVSVADLTSPVVLSLSSTLVLYSLAGLASGYAFRLLRQADDELARSRAREEVSRALHDGVLQTLALVERRASDPQLAAMARSQERDLRAFLAEFAGAGIDASEGRARRPGRRQGAPVPAGQLELRLRRTSSQFEEIYRVRANVVFAPDVPALSTETADALVGAVSEALVNAGKHGGASRVTVFVEPVEGGGVFCSVKDDGTGFDVEATTEGLGISGSIRGRIQRVGGRVEIDGGRGHGAEVGMWL
jgi:signal transduction histidine kinase